MLTRLLILLFLCGFSANSIAQEDSGNDSGTAIENEGTKALRDSTRARRKAWNEENTIYKPIIGLGEYAASSIVFHIKVWVKTEEYWKVFYRFNENIKRAFNEKGISFPYPHMDVNIYKDVKNNLNNK